MAYEDQELKRVKRHTVRFRKDDDALLTLLARRTGMQKATLIQSMTLQAVEHELHRLGLSTQLHRRAGDGPRL